MTTTASPALLVRRDGPIATLTLNRPHVRNAMNYELLQQMPDVARQLDGDPEVRVVVVRGAGEQAFAAGADISEFKERRSTPELAKHYNEVSERAAASVERMQKPTIAMIFGFAMGGGCQLAAVCDLRFAADSAKLGVPAAKLGLAIGLGYSRRLTQLVGPGFTKEILFSGRAFSAQECYDMGLVNRVLPAAELEEYTYSVARQIAVNAPLSIKSAKQSIDICLTNPGLQGVDGHALFGWIFGSEDFAEGTRAFLEKRKPVFRGR